MYEILDRKELNPTVTRIVVYAPYVTRKCEPGQFVIVRAHADGERIPLTIADYSRETGALTLIFQVVGSTTHRLHQLRIGESLADVAGPLGRPFETAGIQKAAVIGGGVGCAIALPIVKKLKEQGATVHSIIGFRTRELVILEDDFRTHSDLLALRTDDGTAGEKGLVTNALQSLIESGEQYDRVIAIGPLIMMKFVCKLTKTYQIPTTVSMNPIMIDGTGMCGGCRLTVGGQMRFACVDGPEFDGHQVDFDEAMERGAIYKGFEQHAYAETCRLFQAAQGE